MRIVETVTSAPRQRSAERPDWRPIVDSIVLPVCSWATWGEEQCNTQPQVGFIEPLVRRRLSFLDRIALHVAAACAPEGERVHLVFASRHGELARSAELLAQIAKRELPSPMSFSLSVLNAAPGLYGIARKDRSASSAVSGGEATFALALIEAAAQAWDQPDATVLLAFADEPPPAVYQEIVDKPRIAHAIGVRMQSRAPRHSVRMGWTPAEGAEPSEEGVRRFAHCLAEGDSARWIAGGHEWRWSRDGNA